MKALLCAACGDVKGFEEDWVSCRCGLVEAHWTDPRLGLGEMQGSYPHAFLLGLNNAYLLPALQGRTAIFEEARKLHEEALDAEGYIFDKSKAACWAVVVKPGQTRDVKWIVKQ